MSRRPLLAGNWKMHLTLVEAQRLVQELVSLCGTDAADVVICPPFTALASAGQWLRGSQIALGAQDVCWEAQGAWTGEISPPMLLDVGCRWVIIGHSERRTHFGESDETVRRKLRAALAYGLTPIVCIGETLAQREERQTLETLACQLDGAMVSCSAAECERVVLAYEPVWAIGTGRNATPEQAQEAHAFIRGWVKARYGDEAAEAVRIQYGGSVTPANAADLLRQPDVNGALVGGASLKAETFAAIVKAAVEVKVA